MVELRLKVFLRLFTVESQPVLAADTPLEILLDIAVAGDSDILTTFVTIIP